jgi:hypothetical protein
MFAAAILRMFIIIITTRVAVRLYRRFHDDKTSTPLRGYQTCKSPQISELPPDAYRTRDLRIPIPVQIANRLDFRTPSSNRRIIIIIITIVIINAEGAPDGPALFTANSSVNREYVLVESTPHRICKTIRTFLLHMIN